jgi:hypothetical protein
MAYHALPKFDPSAQFLVAARLPQFKVVPLNPGEAMPPLPDSPGPRRVYTRQLRQLFDLRKVTMVEPPARPSTKSQKEKPIHGRAKG